jgi:hypothetical protein
VKAAARAWVPGIVIKENRKMRAPGKKPGLEAKNAPGIGANQPVMHFGGKRICR